MDALLNRGEYPQHEPTVLRAGAGQPERTEIARALRELRLEANLTQQDVAYRLGCPQSRISEMESGDRRVGVDELSAISQALGYSVSTIWNRAAGLDSVLDRWGMSEMELTELVDDNPSLRGMVLGYAAESKFRTLHLNQRTDIQSLKDDDHDRTKKGDRRLRYKGHDIVVEIKSLQTNTVEFDERSGIWRGKAQVDGSDRRTVEFSDGSTLETTLLRKGEFDILAINCFAFGDTWRFAFALNEDLAECCYRGYSSEHRSELISSLQKVTWPPREPFTDDFDAILERAVESISNRADSEYDKFEK